MQRVGAVRVLTLTRPTRMNALSTALRRALGAQVRAAVADDDCRAIVLTGAGGNFCSGSDVGQMDQTEMAPRARLDLLHDIVRAIRTSPKPVVAAVEGVAAGAGLSLVVACDCTVAARDARFIPAFARIGLLPDTGIMWSLPRRLGSARSTSFLLGPGVDGVEAHRLGLADLCADPGAALDAALAWADASARNAPLAAAGIKARMEQPPSDLELCLAAEFDAQTPLRESEDHKEAKAAFLEKRPPRFQKR